MSARNAVEGHFPGDFGRRATVSTIQRGTTLTLIAWGLPPALPCGYAARSPDGRGEKEEEKGDSIVGFEYF